MNTNVPYSELKDYELVNKGQDIRGWPVKDGAGSSLGTVKDMLVDTQQERVTTLVLDNGKSVSAKDVSLGDHVVVFSSGSNVRATAAAAPARAAASTGGEQVIPVVDEFMRVGKREVGTGNVKVATHVVSRPVQENVTLRQEQVSVERRPVNRDVSAADTARMQDQSIEMTARSEEAVVAKVARVVEEIVLRKDVAQKTETVRDTVKHTEVQIDDDTVNAGRHRQHFDARYAKTTGASYDQYTPAYNFGHAMRQDSRFHGNDWSEVEPRARSAWEERNPGTWDSFKEAVQHAWTKVAGS